MSTFHGKNTTTQTIAHNRQPFIQTVCAKALTVSTKGQCIVSLPVRILRSTMNMVSPMVFTKPTILSPGSSEPAQLSVLVNGLADPVYSRVTPDGFVLRVHQDDLEELIDRVLGYPVGIQHTEATTIATSTLLHQADKYNAQWGQGWSDY